MMRTVALTTDFGSTDWFAGTMKGVISGMAARTRIVDLNHGIPSGNIRAGAFSLAVSYYFFPRNTIHLVVVDPGVGSQRAGIAVQTGNYFFVGPDNGVLSLALAREKVKSIRRLENKDHFLKPISHTFQGRDIFAPVAAHLSKGLSIRSLGPEQKTYVKLDWPAPQESRNGIQGEVIYIDRFGNAITNIGYDQTMTLRSCQVSERSYPVRRFYQEAEADELSGILGSSGFLEIAVKNDSAAKKFGLKIGDPVFAKISRQPVC